MSRLTIVLCAQPNLDFAPDSHRGSVSIEPREVEVGSIAEALRVFRDFIGDNDLGAGNLGGNAGLIRRDGAPLARIALNGTLGAVDSTGRDTGRQYTRPRFQHVGEVVRFLRESTDLTRNQMADATGNGVSASTIRNLETGRHVASAWTWQRLLQHPALQDFAKLAAESGLEMPIPVPKPGTGSEGPGSGSGSGTPGANTGGSGGSGDGGESGGGSSGRGTP